MPKKPETELYPPIINDPLVRLSMVQRRDGFFPTSLNEITEALELGNKHTEVGGAARHLNNILMHQKKEGVNTDDPNSAVRSVANDYVNYYKSAKKTTEDLTLLDSDVREIDNPFLSLEIALGLDHLGLAGMVRFMDLRRIVSSQAVKDDEPNPLKIDYTKEPKPETISYITDILKSLQIKTVKYIVPYALQDQQNRRDFWHRCLVESANHATARPIVQRALNG